MTAEASRATAAATRAPFAPAPSPASRPDAPLPPARSGAIRIASLEPVLDVVWIVVGVALCVQAWRLGAWSANGPDSGFVPLVAGALIAACAGLLVVRRAMAPARRASNDPDTADTADATDAELFWAERGAWARVCALVAGLVALVLLVRFAGFITASALMMPVLTRLIEKRSWWFAIGIGLAATAAVHVVFTRLLGMSMPRGPWGF